MMNRRLPAVTAGLVLALGGFAAGSVPTFWSSSTQDDFLKGEVENLTIDSDGRLVLGPATELVHETASPFLWSLVAAADGSLYAGSGNDGKVFRIAPGGDVTTLFDADELEVHAVAVGPDREVFAATSPDGKVYRIDRDGTSRIFFDPEDRYIWSLALDADRNLFVGTGDKGVIYRVSPDGRGEAFYNTKATHVTALAVDPEGRVLAGTESPGRIFRIDRQARAFVLLDSNYQEIHSLRLDENGTIYAAAVSGKPAAPAADRPAPEPVRQTAPVPSVSTEITVVAIGGAPAGGDEADTGRRREASTGNKGAVFRIAPDGVWDVLWESSEDTPYDLSLDRSGALIIGTGNKGKIFRVAGEPSDLSLLSTAPAQQVTSLLRLENGQHYYATANPGKILRLSADRASEGRYESEVRDATTVATWGTLRWRSAEPPGTEIRLFTRSGNTATPDETWSAWSEAYTNRDGEQISSPKARYLQWRAVLSGNGATPVLTSVTAAYLERNLRPQVTSVTVHPPGIAFQRPFSTGEMEIAGYETGPTDSQIAAARSAQPTPQPALGRRVYQKGLQTFVWRAEDPNQDDLQYEVLYRSEGETSWKTLRRGLSDPIFVWDTTSVPDGTYTIKIAASDALSNSPGNALTGELESTSFDIDNTPPTIAIGAAPAGGDRRVLTFEVRDAQSPVQRVEYSLDANRWRVVYPKDGIPDSRTEAFELTLEPEAAGSSVILRATDTMSNVATAVAEGGEAARSAGGRRD